MAIYRIILIVLTAACAVGACVTGPLALMIAVMAFDAPGSEQKVWVWVASFAILSIPLWFVVLRGWLRGSLVAAAVPLVAVGVGWRAVCWCVVSNPARYPAPPPLDSRRRPGMASF